GFAAVLAALEEVEVVDDGLVAFRVRDGKVPDLAELGAHLREDLADLRSVGRGGPLDRERLGALQEAFGGVEPEVAHRLHVFLHRRPALVLDRANPLDLGLELAGEGTHLLVVGPDLAELDRDLPGGPRTLLLLQGLAQDAKPLIRLVAIRPLPETA